MDWPLGQRLISTKLLSEDGVFYGILSRRRYFCTIAGDYISTIWCGLSYYIVKSCILPVDTRLTRILADLYSIIIIINFCQKPSIPDT